NAPIGRNPSVALTHSDRGRSSPYKSPPVYAIPTSSPTIKKSSPIPSCCRMRRSRRYRPDSGNTTFLARDTGMLKTTLLHLLTHRPWLDLDRAIFVVGAPRAGAWLLFDLLREAEHVYTLDTSARP